jgi:ankyrin repeat protein
VNAQAGDGGTALMLASQNGHQEVVRALLGAQADVNAKAGNGATALMLASKNGHQEVVQLLKSAGAADR